MRIVPVLILSLFFSSSIFGQTAPKSWALVSSSANQKSSIIDFNKAELKSSLSDLSVFNYNAKSRKKGKILAFPNPDGSEESYEVFETQVMHPDLGSRYPMIKTYIGLSQDTPGKHIRFTNSHKRFTGMIFSPVDEVAYISKAGEVYHCYAKSNYLAKHDTPTFTCGVGESHEIIPEPNSTVTSNKFAGDCNLRTYRLALACTGEYAQFHGGNKPDVLEEMVVSMVRVNGIYESDLGITMVLISNNDDLIYLNSGSDPYNNNNTGSMLGQNQTAVDDVIGSANYDIGHVYGTGDGGIASLQAPCNSNRKARGVTGRPNPTGDPFWVDYVAHEMGHQFGANHTQNNSCQRNQATAMEPGSASTIMGYAGICNPNVQNNSDDHFHAVSIEEIANYTTQGQGNNCPVITDTQNSQPTIVEQNTTYNLPVDTPFRLIADAADEDETDILTFCWEQMDNEVASMPPSPLNSVGPAFRSNSPTTSPIRYFPNIQSILNNISPTWEVIPIVSRDMDFRCTVRDNSPLNGCTNEIDVSLEFHDSAGPFVVTSQNSSEEWFSFSTQTITWDVAGTDIAPVETPMVDILLSLDGGQTYSITLVEGVPNTGEASITVPNVESTQARVMVTGHQNVFFDINNSNINIVRTSFTLEVDPVEIVTCNESTTNFIVNYEEFEAFEEIVNLSITGFPAEITTTLSQVTIEETGQIMVDLDGLDNVSPGSYPFQINGMSDNQVYFANGVLLVLTSELATPFLESPADGEVGLGLRPAFDWISSGNVQDYEIQIATNPSFGNTIVVEESGMKPGDEIETSLNANTVYYWKINASSSCAINEEESSVYSFQTGFELCEVYPGLIQPLPIPLDEVISVRSLTQVTKNVTISRMSVTLDIEHTFVGDLAVTLETQSGDKVDLINRPGVPNTDFGCAGNDIQVNLFDAAIKTAADLESTCEGSQSVAISGEFQPIDLLSRYTGTQSVGIWFLDIVDFKAGDGGALNSWSLEVCALDMPTETFELALDTFYVNRGAALEIKSKEIFGDDPEPSNLRYTLTSIPNFGILQLFDDNGVYTDLSIGGTFTQADIDAEKLLFQSLDVEEFDSFTFDAVNSSNIWSSNNRLDIKIYGPSSVQNEISDLDLKISPNPGNGLYDLQFLTKGSDKYTLDIYSVSGKKIKTETINGTGDFGHALDLSNMNDGVYLLVIENETHERNSYRLIKN